MGDRTIRCFHSGEKDVETLSRIPKFSLVYVNRRTGKIDGPWRVVNSPSGVSSDAAILVPATVRTFVSCFCAERL